MLQAQRAAGSKWYGTCIFIDMGIIAAATTGLFPLSVYVANDAVVR